MIWRFWSIVSGLAHISWFVLTMYLFLSRDGHVDRRRRLQDSWYTYDRNVDKVYIHKPLEFTNGGGQITSNSTGPTLQHPHKYNELDSVHSFLKHDKLLKSSNANEILNSMSNDQLLRVNWLINWKLNKAGIDVTNDLTTLNVDNIIANNARFMNNALIHNRLITKELDVSEIEPYHE
jgi:hypothetical protein